jgi:hypothetical protein
MDKCIVNFGSGSFSVGQERLKRTFRAEGGYEGDFLCFTNEIELDGCPSHSQVPYAFKAYAMKRAQAMGYKKIMWIDSSVYAVKPISKAFEIIDRLGYLLLPGGWNTGQWCSDAALETLGLERESSFDIPHIMACVMGLDLTNEKSCAFLDRYYECANDGITFHGAWSNTNREVSQDERVLGHRHDQTAASAISWKLGMRDWQPNLLIYDETGDTPVPENAIFVLRHHLA